MIINNGKFYAIELIIKNNVINNILQNSYL